MASTVYVKGSRKRTESSGMMGMGGDVADIEQCDLKRTVKVSDKKKLYYVEPFATDSGDPPQAASPSPAASGKTVKGGTVTMTSVITDTGERKQLFGLTARHIKTSMTMRSSPDACSKQDTTIETDGWYVDLPQFSCPVTSPRNPYAAGTPEKRGCTDRMITKSSGSGKLGFALSLTQTIKSGDDDGMSFSQSMETLEFSKSTLDDSLFDIPAGYKPANSANDLYGRPDFSAMARGQNSGDDEKPRPSTQKTITNTGSQNSGSQAKRPGTVRIGVLPPTNRSGEDVSTTNLQSFLIGKLSEGRVEAISVGSEADARAAGCDYLLSSDFSKLKQSTSSKIGGILGKVTNTDTSAARNYDAQVDFKLISLSTGQQVIQSKAAAKTESNVDRAAEGVLAIEANAVLGVAK
jgi:hypothetical protein